MLPDPKETINSKNVNALCRRVTKAAVSMLRGGCKMLILYNPQFVQIADKRHRSYRRSFRPLYDEKLRLLWLYRNFRSIGRITDEQLASSQEYPVDLNTMT